MSTRPGAGRPQDHERDGVGAAGAKQVGTDRVTRRYRRGPGGWWWLALLLVPAILAALGLALGGGDDDKTASGQETSTSTSAPSETSSDAETTDAASAAAAPWSAVRAGDDLTVTAQVPDEAAKTALLDGVKSEAGDGVTVIDKVTIKDGAVAPAAAAVGGVVGAAGEVTDFNADWDGSALTLKGKAPSQDVSDAVEEAATTDNPDATIDNQITVDGKGAGGDDATAAGCDTLGADINTLLKKTKITFVTNGSGMTAASDAAVKEIAEKASKCKDAKLSVRGHTDNTGTQAINKPLSTQRAEIVKAALIKGGVAKANVTAAGFGSSKPITSNSTESGRSANRRVEITVK